jgi:hypothetical protein
MASENQMTNPLIQGFIRAYHPRRIYEWEGGSSFKLQYRFTPPPPPPPPPPSQEDGEDGEAEAQEPQKPKRGPSLHGILIYQLTKFGPQVYWVTMKPFEAIRLKREKIVFCDAKFERDLKRDFPRASVRRITLPGLEEFGSLILVSL